MFVEIIKDHFRLFAALQLYHDAHAIPITLVPDIGDALDFPILYQLGDALDGLCFINLVRDFCDDDLLLVFGRALDRRLCAHGELAPAGRVRRADAASSVKISACGKIRPGNQREDLIKRCPGLVDHQNGCVDDFRQVVRRDLRSHAHGDPVRTVDQKIGDLGGQDRGLLRGFVKVRDEVHGFFLNVGQHFRRQPREPTLGIPVGCGPIAINRAEIALAIDERVAHIEVLRHTHQGIVDCRVAMRVVFLDYLAHNARALYVALVRGDALLIHSVEDAPVHRFQSVADLGQRASDDHAHGVIEIRVAHLVFDIDGNLPCARN